MIEGIAFEGGGVLGMGHVGAIIELKKRGIYDNIKYFTGASVGSIMACLCACGATPEFLKYAVDLDFNGLLDGDYGVFRDLNRLRTRYGLYKGDELERLLSNYLEELTILKVTEIGGLKPSNFINGEYDMGGITFQQVYDLFGTDIIIPTTKVTKESCCSLYYSRKDTPDVPIKRAARKSSSYPFVFSCKDSETDGGVLDNYPIKALYPYTKKVLGLKFTNVQTNPCQNEPEDIFDFSMSLINGIRTQAMKMHVGEEEWKKTIKIDVCDISSMNFAITEEEKQYLLESGKKGVDEYYNH